MSEYTEKVTSKFKEKSEYMAMKVSGFLGWLHRVVMFITFPIRKFWLIVIVLAVILAILIAIPMFYGIQLRDVWDWYMVKMPTHEFVEAKDKTLFGAKEQVDKVRRSFNEIIPNKKSASTAKKESKPKETVKLVSWNVAEFRKAKYVPQKQFPVIKKVEKVTKEEVVSPIETIEVAQEVETPAEVVVISEEQYTEPKRDTAEVIRQKSEFPIEENDTEMLENVIKYDTDIPANIGNIEDYYIVYRSPNLTYLEVPEIKKGKVRVSSANGLYVDGEFVYLYGIFSDSKRHDVDGAVRYLRNITEGKNIYCVAIAYSHKTQDPAALCFVNGVLINKSLVDHNLANNIALK